MKMHSVLAACLAAAFAAASARADKQVTDVNGRVWTVPDRAVCDGRILRVEIPAGRPGTVLAESPVSLAAFEDGELEFSIHLKAADVSKPPQSWNGVKAMLTFTDVMSGRARYPGVKVPSGTSEGTYVKVVPLYGKTVKASLRLGLEAVSGTAEFDLASLKFARTVGKAFKNPRYRVAYPERVQRLPQLRGAMVSPNVKAEDLEALRALGATLFRYQICAYGSFYNKGETEDETIADFNDALEKRLEIIETVVLPTARRLGMKFAVDLHMFPENYLWKSRRTQDAFVEAWRQIARRLKGNEEFIYGYDIINEPMGPGFNEEINRELQLRCAYAIREIDPEATLIYSPGGGWPTAYAAVDPLPLDNVIYTVHIYQPLTYTHQHVGKGKPEYAYRQFDQPLPADLDAYLRDMLAEARGFQRRHNCRIFVGEFSAVLYAPGADKYLETVTDILYEYGWDWTYHAFRESKNWSIEHVATSPTAERKPSTDNPRYRVMTKALTAP